MGDININSMSDKLNGTIVSYRNSSFISLATRTTTKSTTSIDQVAYVLLTLMQLQQRQVLFRVTVVTTYLSFVFHLHLSSEG